ncbi:MAG: AAA family ATPase [Brasilonema angustatum HA4187-MV1]|jgi:cellulose biosynthesis protein BcsQ|nr:AAA family ATPase [Brasilonema angustatum HA4187-MV1]
MEYYQLKQVLLSLPANAQESIVGSIFVPEFLKALGYDITETVPQFATGSGADTVDYAVRKNIDNDVFINTKSSPYLLLELKGRDINLSENSTQYKSTVSQLKRYLLASNSKSAQWGIITNSNHIQLFRKHGKVVHPSSRCLEITPDNLYEIVEIIKSKIDTPQRALTVAIYNNKGGVGKTTTTVNLAATLAFLGKRVLILDFDPNQQDLTNSLDIKLLNEDALYSWLDSKPSPSFPSGVMFRFSYLMKGGNTVTFDVIPSDKKLTELGQDKLRQVFRVTKLKQVIDPFKSAYDYILIDSPPNWMFFSQSALCASDVVLIPTKHNNIFSLQNAAIVIKQFIPEIQDLRKDGGPVALPIFFNGESITQAARVTADQALDEIIQQAIKNKTNSFDLTPYFYSLHSKAKPNRYIFNLPSYAHIAGAAFTRIPSVYKNITAYNYYLALAKEYFLQ